MTITSGISAQALHKPSVPRRRHRLDLALIGLEQPVLVRPARRSDRSTGVHRRPGVEAPNGGSSAQWTRATRSVRLASHRRTGAADQEVEVGPGVGTLHVVDVEAFPAADGSGEG